MTEDSPKRGLFGLFRRGLAKSRENLLAPMARILVGNRRLDASLLEDLEELLIGVDLGFPLTMKMIGRIEDAQKARVLNEPSEVRDFLRQALQEVLISSQSRNEEVIVERGSGTQVVLVVGVNGTGKTTSIGKLAHYYQSNGRKVLLAAGDTFRAAAVEQLDVWRKRAGVEIVRGTEGADASAVIFDAAEAAIARNVDFLIADTAGRLHTRQNLMDELKKVVRTLGRVIEGAPHEVLLVLDATAGQNSIPQAKKFLEEIGVTGLILTKLDGTSKGGVVISIVDELGIPVRYAGFGEEISDFQPFDAEVYIQALFEE